VNQIRRIGRIGQIRKMKLLNPILICLSVVSVFGCKQEEKALPQDQPTVEWNCPTNAIHVGDPVELLVTAYFPTNGVIEFPEIGREKDVVLLNRDWQNIPREDALTQAEVRYSLTSFRLGDHKVSSSQILCHVGGQTFTNDFPHVVLKVVSALPDESSTELDGIKPMQKLPGRVPRWIWIVLGTAAIAFLIGSISSKLWKNRDTLIPKPPPIPPHVRAFQALKELMDKGLLEKDECNPFYTELSKILREYLEGRFHLNAPDETTEEIIEALSQSPELTGAQRNILQEFMRQADIVKFAKGHPDRTTMESAFGTTKEFVEQIRLRNHEGICGTD